MPVQSGDAVLVIVGVCLAMCALSAAFLITLVAGLKKNGKKRVRARHKVGSEAWKKSQIRNESRSTKPEKRLLAAKMVSEAKQSVAATVRRRLHLFWSACIDLIVVAGKSRHPSPSCPAI